jgi:PadR family transcriptional regulator, regulatory protein PadR
MKNDTTKGQLDLLLLSVLDSGPGHGYELIARLRTSSSGTFDLPEGTVYPALHRLETAGLIAAGTETVAGRRRRIYTLTTQGAGALVAHTTQWREHRDAMGRVLGGGSARGNGRMAGATA